MQEFIPSHSSLLPRHDSAARSGLGRIPVSWRGASTRWQTGASTLSAGVSGVPGVGLRYLRAIVGQVTGTGTRRPHGLPVQPSFMLSFLSQQPYHRRGVGAVTLLGHGTSGGSGGSSGGGGSNGSFGFADGSPGRSSVALAHSGDRRGPAFPEVEYATWAIIGVNVVVFGLWRLRPHEAMVRNFASSMVRFQGGDAVFGGQCGSSLRALKSRAKAGWLRVHHPRSRSCLCAFFCDRLCTRRTYGMACTGRP
jgi:hypothetical protein